ncbi:MAG TPA: hypothetical protein PK677_11220 [Acidiphilium sp.]|nr:hypothetical protein [Acidiphilium sp.]
MNDNDEEDYRRDEYFRRKRDVWCKCGNPDLPGSCPGWRSCPMHGEDVEAEGDEE